MAKIVRTAKKATGGVTPAELVKMKDHAALWISRAMRTDPIEADKIVPAIEGIYAAAGLKKPRVVIAPSPMVMAFAYGASAAIWHVRGSGKVRGKATLSATDAATDAATHAATHAATLSATWDATRPATWDATWDATRAATHAATHAATDAATWDATRAATHAATHAATRAATHAATRAATRVATRAATWDATLSVTDDATLSATDDATRAATDAATSNLKYDKNMVEKGAIDACYALAGNLGIECARNWHSVYQGGNMWAGYESYISAFRDIIGLKLKEHDKYAPWEQAAIHGGFRVMHPEFCIVSDFPEVLKVDAENRPHCENGPSHRWRDGWSLYFWHGVQVPSEWIEDKASLTAKTALTWGNIEQRRAACEILGWAKILKELDAKTIDRDDDPEIGELVEVNIPDVGRERFLRVLCGTGREFALPVPPTTKTALEGNAWTFDLDGDVLRKLEVRT